MNWTQPRLDLLELGERVRLHLTLENNGTPRGRRIELEFRARLALFSAFEWQRYT